MKYNSARHHRRTLRLKGYDYTQNGAYYVTICTQKRLCLLGTIKDRKMVLNEAGQMIKNVWDELPQKHCGIEKDQYIIMPNHMHGIIFIVGAGLVPALSLPTIRDSTERAGTRPAPTTSLGYVVGIFKSISTHTYAINVNAKNWTAFPGKLWQRNYYERIIRNEGELNRIREYILNNPQQWDNDDNNPHKTT